jgi:adenine/guanine/hypoxanthine permease
MHVKEHYVPWWQPGDWNAFLGLFTNIIANILVAASLLIFVVRIPADVVYGKIVPAMGIAICLGNVYYSYMARKLAMQNRLSGATALPYGPSVGHLFVVTLLIILPVFRKTGDATLAWMVGVAWCMVESLVEIAAAWVGPWVRKHTPRAAMLAVMAGIAITLIAMRQILLTWEVAYIGFISLAFVLIAWTGRKRLPFNIPAAVWMVVIGSAIAWAGTYMGWIPDGGKMSAQAVQRAFSGLTFTFPGINITWQGFVELVPFLPTALAFGLGGFLNTMDNVESASAAGDDFDTREALIADATGSAIGALFGSPYATGVYVGHPGWKAMGAGVGYTMATGIAVLAVTFIGVVPLFGALIPLVAVLPILIYIGMVMGAQAFQATPPSHAPAVILALLPWFASWGKGLVDNALAAAGTNAATVTHAKLAASNILYRGMEMMDQGVVITSMLLGAIGALVIDHRWKAASVVAVLAGVLAYVGLIHAPRLGWNMSPQLTISYLVVAGILYGVSLMDGKAEQAGDEARSTADD